MDTIPDIDCPVSVTGNGGAMAFRAEDLTSAASVEWFTRTFLLTDIVGSVSLWERDPAAMSEATARHEAIIQACVMAHGGELVRTKGEGDSTFSVFADPSAALAAAAGIQQAITCEPWPPTTSLQVRAGVHSGGAEPRDGDWYGPVVNRAARLRGLADAGQTLVSGVTAGLVADQMPTATRVLYRGRRLLRGIERPEEVWELVADDDPRLAIVESTPWGDLPGALTRFVGRAEDLDSLAELVRAERLVTLTGPGGSGKTRLALEVARNAERRGERVWLAELASLRESDQVAHAVATAVLLESTPDPVSELLDHADALSGLLVLDNCEHLRGACERLVKRLLQDVPGISVLATSREPLHVAGEREWPVRPLRIPDESERQRSELDRIESVQLLLDRARAVRPDLEVEKDDELEAVVKICRSLDGVPLAIELAAGRLRSLSLTDLAARLDDQLVLLARPGTAAGDEARHQTLRMALDWSYELLTDEQRAVAARLSVFAGGFRLDAVEAVCDGDVDVFDSIDELVAKSLVTFDSTTARYRLLEPLRQYLAERLDASDGTEHALRMHANWVVDLAEGAEHGFFKDQAAWARRLDAERPNIRAAIARSLDHGAGVTALRIAAALGYVWFTMGQPDARVTLDRALSAAGAVDSRLRARGLLAAGMLAHDTSDVEGAQALLEEALSLFTSSGDRLGVAWTLTWLAKRPAPEDYARVTGLLEEALAIFRDAQDAPGIASTLGFLAHRRVREGDADGARVYAEEALQSARQAGATQPMAEALRLLGEVKMMESDLVGARRLFEEAAAIHRSGRDRRQEILAVTRAGNASEIMADLPAAFEHYARSAELIEDIASPDSLTVLLQSLAMYCWRHGRRHEAALLLGAYDSILPYYVNDHVRRVAERIGESGLESARAEGRRLSFDEMIAKVRLLVDDEMVRLRDES